MDTYKRYGISLNHLKRFMRKKYNVSDMAFQALTSSFVTDYDYYLRVELRIASQTIVGIIGKLRRIVKIAINNGLVRNDPFIGYEFITSPIVPKSLTSAELKKMMKAKLSKPYLGFVRDCLKLRKKNRSQSRLFFSRKTEGGRGEKICTRMFFFAIC
jgi:hypothetical protein